MSGRPGACPAGSEHPLLMALVAKRQIFASSASTTRTTRRTPRVFSARSANPLPRSAPMRSGRVSLDWGVYGVPETFIVDGEGVIRFKWIGPLERGGNPRRARRRDRKARSRCDQTSSRTRDASRLRATSSSAAPGPDLAHWPRRFAVSSILSISLGEHRQALAEGPAIGGRDHREDLLVDFIGARLRQL